MPAEDKRIIATDQAPAAVGPYSQAVAAGNLVFTAGQIGLDPVTGQLVDGGVEAQARQALTNLRAVLEAAGSSLDRIVKVTLYLKDMNDFKAVNAIYAGFFRAEPPARSAIQAAALPLGSLVEIDAIALTP